jgi:protein phosphatase
MTPMLRAAAALTVVGKVRNRNEDCAAVDGQRVCDGVLGVFAFDDASHLFVVADGMGGHANGEVASALAVATLNGFAGRLRDPTSCVEALRITNDRIYEEMSREKALIGMGTTIVGFVVRRQTLIWFNVGDSRAYLYRGGDLRQLTTDHVPDEIRGLANRRSHAITQSLGGSIRPARVVPAVGIEKIYRGDKLLLCTDGLTDVVCEDRITCTLRLAETPDKAVRDLVAATLAAGAPDNVTVLVVVL